MPSDPPARPVLPPPDADPRRWSTPGRTHPLSPWLGLSSIGRELVPAVLAALALGRLAILPVVAGVLVGSRLLGWWRRTWSFDGGHITLDDGVLRRTRRRVPVGRMQQVGVTEPLLHRVAGLAVVRVETAGAAGRAELRLDALPRAEALELRSALIAARAVQMPAPSPAAGDAPADVPVGAPVDTSADTGGPPPAAAGPGPPASVTPVVRLGVGRLALAGVTGANLLVALAVIGALADALTRLPRSLVEELGDTTGTLVVALGVGVTAVVLVTVVLGLAAVASVVSHHDLTVELVGDDLHLRRGLLERREAVVPRRRVQSVVVVQHPVQRVLGLAAVRIRSAGSGAGDDERVLVPLADRAEVDRLVEAAIGRHVDLDELGGAPRAARSRRLARRIVPLGAGLATLVALGVAPRWVVVVAGVGLVGAVVSALDAYRALGVRLDDDVVVARRGSVSRRTSVAVRARIQSGRVRSSPLQRRRGLATAHADLAGAWGTMAVLDQPADRCDALVAALTAAAPRPSSR